MKFELIVVDDEDMALEGLRAFPWREYGFQLVSCFQDPTEVIGWLKSHTVQLIVADVRMPGMSGLELTKKVHELFPDIAVVLLSGHSEFSYAQKALKYGVLRYVLKPIDDEEFGAVLHEIHHFLEKREDKKKWNHSVLREYSINRLLEHKTDDIVLQSSPMDELKKFRVALVRQKTGNLKVSMHGYEDLIF